MEVQGNRRVKLSEFNCNYCNKAIPRNTHRAMRGLCTSCNSKNIVTRYSRLTATEETMAEKLIIAEFEKNVNNTEEFIANKLGYKVHTVRRHLGHLFRVKAAETAKKANGNVFIEEVTEFSSEQLEIIKRRGLSRYDNLSTPPYARNLNVIF